ncbi:MAG: hypothetical protein KDC66_11975 [Phaeodactylibacter sp.]|nr:hypothetical protein [Phaeodactylibacter sp.]MCB9273346.1 hypothetical protein [Lewinellaceae bacterium]
MMLNKALIILLALSLHTLASGQRSNIYLFDIRQDDGGKISLADPRFLTAFNAQGVNTDPSFFSPNELYIVSQLANAIQTDIYKLDLIKFTKTQVTSTPESETAPARMPDMYNFSAIRREKDGRDSLLRLWQFPVDQLTNGKPLFKYLSGVEEYYWLNSRDIVIYKGGDPTTLSIMDTNNDKLETIATNVGHTFARMPNGNLAFVQKSRYDDWKLMEKNLYRPKEVPRTIIETLPGAEHFAVLPDGTFLMAKGSKIYKYNKFSDDNWKEAVDLRFYEIRNITKLVVGPERVVSTGTGKGQTTGFATPIAIVAE